MARYLTPSKITLLSLVELYCRGEVSNSATVPVLSFIVSQLFPAAPSNSQDTFTSSAHNFHLSIDDFENVTITQASSIPGRTVWDLLLRQLWAIDTLDALHVYFDALAELLVRSKEEQQKDAEQGVAPPPLEQSLLSRTSPLGVFVRRAQVEFDRLTFDDSAKLWVAFSRFREPTLGAWRKRNPAAEDVSDINLQGFPSVLDLFDSLDEHGGDAEEGTASIDDIEKILEFQVDRLQKLGNRIPVDMKAQFQTMLRSSSIVPSLNHFVKFFDAWRAGDYTTSFDSLHRYFDYTMQNRDRTYYQYALLHMAVLHADFGCIEEAIATMQETIATARENQDMSCLNFSLSWLYHLSKAYPQAMKGTGYDELLGSERDGLAFLKAKAKETKSWSLLSSTHLSEAKLAMSCGEGIPKVFEHNYQSSHLNVTHNITSAQGSFMLMQSALAERLGQVELSESYLHLLLECYNINTPQEELIRARCRMAYLDAQRGRYDSALGLLADQQVQTLKFQQILISYSGLIKLKRQLRRNNLFAAGHLLRQLRAAAIPDPDISFEISTLNIKYTIRQHNYQTAYDMIEDLADSLKEQGADIYQRIKVLIMKAQLWATVGKPEKGFTVSLRAANVALRAKVLPSLWEAVGCVANILIHLKEFRAASQLLDAIIPHAIHSKDSELCARLYSFQVDCHMGVAGHETKPGGRQRGSRLAAALKCIDTALQYYRHVEEIEGQLDMLSKKAIVYRVMGDVDLSDDASATYVETRDAALVRMREENGWPDPVDENSEEDEG